MLHRQNPPPDLQIAARHAGFPPFLGAWYRSDELADPRQYAGVRCRCVPDGKLVLLTRVETPSGAYRVGRCSGCQAVVWSPCLEVAVHR